MAIFRDSASYRLGRLGTLKLDRGARNELRRLMMDKGVGPAAERIAARCNEASAWGGYEARTGRQAAFVVAKSAKPDSNRGRRILTAASGAADLL